MVASSKKDFRCACAGLVPFGVKCACTCAGDGEGFACVKNVSLEQCLVGDVVAVEVGRVVWCVVVVVVW